MTDVTSVIYPVVHRLCCTGSIDSALLGRSLYPAFGDRQSKRQIILQALRECLLLVSSHAHVL